ncbi:hypothetical protein FRC04_000869 [Tulasnella sp. 424]|nr:hypothetical protein FRC04_000869 [Tulasnella sp. 424]
MVSINPSTISYVDIYPPIAIAHVGDSDQWFMGPEIPGVDPVPAVGFKDSNHKIKRCAPRFRIYAFDGQDKVLGEINLQTDPRYKIEWGVHVANKKSAWVNVRGQGRPETFKLRNASVQPLPKDSSGQDIQDDSHCDKRDKLIIDSGLQFISGKSTKAVPLQGEFWGSKSKPTQIKMGAIETDDLGRLIVHGGDGHASSLDQSHQTLENQAFLSGSFDDDNWFDTMFDGHVTAKVTFADNGSQQEVRVKNRSTVVSAPPHYAYDDHRPTDENAKGYTSFDEIPLSDQPHALTAAAFEWSVGASLFPGIERFWVAEFGEMYDLNQPFSYRFGEKAQPGNLTRGLALPWQADFYDCNTHWWPAVAKRQTNFYECKPEWWPAVRPDDVVTEEYFTEVQQDSLVPELKGNTDVDDAEQLALLEQVSERTRAQVNPWWRCKSCKTKKWKERAPKTIFKHAIACGFPEELRGSLSAGLEKAKLADKINEPLQSQIQAPLKSILKKTDTIPLIRVEEWKEPEQEPDDLERLGHGTKFKRPLNQVDPVFDIPGKSGWTLRTDSTARRRHIRILGDILYVSIQRRDWQRAKRAWGLLLRTPEVEWNDIWRIGLLLLHKGVDVDKRQASEERIEWLKLMMRKIPYYRETTLQELVIELILAKDFKQAEDQLFMYMAEYPFYDNATLRGLSGLLYLYNAQPREPTPNDNTLPTSSSDEEDEDPAKEKDSIYGEPSTSTTRSGATTSARVATQPPKPPGEHF